MSLILLLQPCDPLGLWDPGWLVSEACTLDLKDANLMHPQCAWLYQGILKRGSFPGVFLVIQAADAT